MRSWVPEGTVLFCYKLVASFWWELSFSLKSVDGLMIFIAIKDAVWKLVPHERSFPCGLYPVCSIDWQIWHRISSIMANMTQRISSMIAYPTRSNHISESCFFFFFCSNMFVSDSFWLVGHWIVRNGLEIILLIFLSFSFTKDESEFLLPQCYSVVSKAKDVRRFGYSQFGTITAWLSCPGT